MTTTRPAQAIELARALARDMRKLSDQHKSTHVLLFVDDVNTIAATLDALADACEQLRAGWHDSNVETPAIGEYYLVKGIRENRPTMCQAWNNSKTGVWNWHKLGEKGFHPHANTVWMSIPD